ncbi:hypothetical protein J4710_10070 [Staphylococcus xylosus]|uniref:Uncharacterized protein n=1 Tax=Staphylococcus xylosus TaxID=1288 RepID=A0A939NJ19_STAXY|nr:hypothetical protein [Staphylococcus xylosus]
MVKLESQEDTNLNIKAINASTAVKSSQIITNTEAVNSLAKQILHSIQMKRNNYLILVKRAQYNYVE